MAFGIVGARVGAGELRAGACNPGATGAAAHSQAAGAGKASHVQRLQKTLEEANIKIESVLSDVMGRSGRAMIQALIRLTRSLRGPKFLSTSYSLGQVGTDWQFVGLGGFFVAAGAHGGYECPQSLIRTSKVFSTLCGWRHIFKTSRDAISKRSGFHPIY